MAITPDTKDWTWVLDRPCEECGTEAAAYDPATVPEELRPAIERWRTVLARPDPGRRSDDRTWSPLEYAAHVSEALRVFDDRLALMLSEHRPTFDDWDQDTAAVTGDYGDREPVVVAQDLARNAQRVAAAFGRAPEGDWDRRGYRSDGAPFTVRTLAQYMIHDVLHHLHDVDG